MKLTIVEKKTYLAGLQCTLTSSCAKNKWSKSNSAKWNAIAENLSQAQKINSAKYGANFVIILYYHQTYCTTSYEHKELRAINYTPQKNYSKTESSYS